MIFSNVIAFSIILTTAAVLNAGGVTNINSATQAAEALRPLAGDFTFLLFALGIIGTGMLAIPVLAGSAAYGVSEAFGWPATLEAKAPDAVGFYTIIAAATVIGFGLGFTGIDAIHMLVWSAVLNGIVAVPIMAMMMVIVANLRLMGRFKAPAPVDRSRLDRHRTHGFGGGRVDLVFSRQLSLASPAKRPLLHAPPLKEALVGRVLVDVGSVALFGGILCMTFLRRRIASGIGVGRFWSLVASIPRRDGRHVTGHGSFLAVQHRPVPIQAPARTMVQLG